MNPGHFIHILRRWYRRTAGRQEGMGRVSKPGFLYDADASILKCLPDITDSQNTPQAHRQVHSAHTVAVREQVEQKLQFEGGTRGGGMADFTHQSLSEAPFGGGMVDFTHEPLRNRNKNIRQIGQIRKVSILPGISDLSIVLHPQHGRR